MGAEKLHISNFPDEVRDTVCDRVAQFTVGLSRVVSNQGSTDVKLIGTGTLVEVSGLHCILTADHVVERIRKSDKLNLLTSFSGEIRIHNFEYSHLDVRRVARGTDDSIGPDIGLIVLPDPLLGSLKSEKVFFNIDLRKERFANAPIDKELGFWFTPGILGETEQPVKALGQFKSVKGYQGLCGVAANPMESELADFDYIELPVDYNVPNSILPDSFGGCSGAGLWQVQMHRNEKGELEDKECILSGIVFYQTAVENGVRKLRCHGRKSIYRNLANYADKIRP